MGLDYSMLLDFVIEYHLTIVFTLTKGEVALREIEQSQIYIAPTVIRSCGGGDTLQAH